MGVRSEQIMFRTDVSNLILKYELGMSLTDDSLFGKMDGQLVNSGPTAVNPYGSKR